MPSVVASPSQSCTQTKWFYGLALPKVVSKFHVAQDITLPVFFPSPTLTFEQTLHTLDVRRGLLF